MSKDYDDFVERMTSFDLDLSADGTTGANMRVSDSKPSLDTALAHYGVKGMQWGVRKERKEAVKSARAADNKRVLGKMDKVGRAEDRLNTTFNKVRSENRAKGMGRIEAGRAANKDPRVKKAEAAVNKADAELGATTAKGATSTKAVKAKISQERAQNTAATNRRFNDAYLRESGKGHRWASAFLTGGLSVGYNYQRSAGYSVGASTATTLLVGPWGNVAAVAIAERNARVNN